MASPTVEDEGPSGDSFSLKIITAASFGSSENLLLSQLSPASTVKLLKEKIRDALPSKPSEDSQRLIYRGRMLSREDETMNEIFGNDAVRGAEPPVIHLVLRPTGAPSTTQSRSSTPSQNMNQPSMPFLQSNNTTQSGISPLGQTLPQPILTDRQFPPNGVTTFTQAGVGPNGRWNTTSTQTRTTISSTIGGPEQQNPHSAHALAIQNHIHAMQNALMQNQLARGAPNPVQTPSSTTSGAVEVPSASAGDVSNGNHTSTLVDRPFPVTSSLPRPPISPSIPEIIALRNAAQGFIAPGGIVANTVGSVSTPSSTNAPYPIVGPTVYLLSSPSGPNALLLAPSAGGAIQRFTTSGGPHIFLPPIASSFPPLHPLPQFNRQLNNNGEHGTNAGRADTIPPAQRPENDAAAAPPVDNAAQPQVGQAANPNARPAPVQLGQHLWLIIRLLGFVWWFTSGHSSWWRTIMISFIAFLVFLYNTGLFDNIAINVWNPIRGHLDALLPLQGPQAAAAQAPAPVNAAGPPAGDGAPAIAGTDGPERRAPEPDPAHLAARLLAQRRQVDRTWLWTQFRRVEHATILFLASLVPGVGERHIAARAAEDNLLLEAERQRAAAAAEASSAAAAAEEGNADEIGSGAAEDASSAPPESQRASERDGEGEEASLTTPEREEVAPHLENQVD